MCDPVSLGITAASMLAKSYFDNKAAGEVADAQTASQQTFNRDIDEQRGKSFGEFQGSVEESGKTADDQKRAEAVTAREEAYQPSFDQKVLLPGQGDANNAVRTAIVTAQNEGIAQNADSATRRANLDAFGDVDLGRNIKLLQNANRISKFGDFAMGAYPVLQADLGAATHAGDKSSNIGDIIGAIGTIGSAGYDAASGAGWFGKGQPVTTDFYGNKVGTFQKVPVKAPNTIKNPNIAGTRYSL
jgi:hypothetical protein